MMLCTIGQAKMRRKILRIIIGKVDQNKSIQNPRNIRKFYKAKGAQRSTLEGRQHLDRLMGRTPFSLISRLVHKVPHDFVQLCFTVLLVVSQLFYRIAATSIVLIDLKQCLCYQPIYFFTMGCFNLLEDLIILLKNFLSQKYPADVTKDHCKTTSALL